MALIQCPHCGKKISDLASACPFCDMPLRQDARKKENNPYYNEEQDGYTYYNADSRAKASRNGSYRSYTSYRPAQDPSNSRGYTGQSAPNHQPVNTSVKPPETPPAQAPEKPASEGNTARRSQSSYADVRSRPGRAGRRLLGFRSGKPWHMFIMLLYDLCAAVLILYGFKMIPQYADQRLRILQAVRTVISAFILYLPVILLSNTGFRRALPLLKKKSPSAAILSLILGYIPLIILFTAVFLQFKA